MDWVWNVIKAYRHGNLRTGTPVTTVERFLTEQTELMKQMERNNERLYKVTIKGFNQLADMNGNPMSILLLMIFSKNLTN